IPIRSASRRSVFLRAKLQSVEESPADSKARMAEREEGFVADAGWQNWRQAGFFLLGDGVGGFAFAAKGLSRKWLRQAGLLLTMTTNRVIYCCKSRS